MMPVLYSFRRCPYAMRARLALRSARQQVQLREVVLRDKPAAFLATSPSGTVPCLALDTGEVIDESLDIMIWALRRHDPEGLLNMPDAGWDWINRCDGPFKHALDRTKYATRYPDADPEAERGQKPPPIWRRWTRKLAPIFFDTPSLADMAIAPFVRQFAFIDKTLVRRAALATVASVVGAVPDLGGLCRRDG